MERGTISILSKFGVDDKSLALIQQTLTNTYYHVKFLDKLSKMFEIKIGLRHKNKNSTSTLVQL